MARSSDGIELTLFSKPQLLITESAEEFAALPAQHHDTNPEPSLGATSSKKDQVAIAD
jgi:hypothetical protein